LPLLGHQVIEQTLFNIREQRYLHQVLFPYAPTFSFFLPFAFAGCGVAAGVVVRTCWRNRPV
jgi:hypothetical protein